MLQLEGRDESISIGVFGIVHPEVLEKFEISFPCSVFEIDMGYFL